MKRIIAFVAAAAAGITTPASGSNAASIGDIDKEALISAAVVYNIARFSTWPDENREATFFEVCYDSGSGLGDAFATIAGKDVGGKPVKPVAIQSVGMPDARCHIYFTDRKSGYENNLISATSQGTLTIGRDDAFLERGGAVRVSIKGRPKFSVNVTNAHAAGVRPSSKLLQLAEEVTE